MVEPLTPATLAAALAVWATAEAGTGPTRLHLRRSPRFLEALKALDAIPASARLAASDAAERAYRAEATARFPEVPEALRSRPTPEPDPARVALARELNPFGDGRLANAVEDAKRALERAALDPDPPRSLHRWLGDFGPRLAKVHAGLVGDAETEARTLALEDLIDPRFRD